MSKHKICKLPEEIQSEINSFLNLKCNNCKYCFKFEEVLSGITKRTDLIIPNLPSKEYFDIKFITAILTVFFIILLGIYL